MRHHLPDQVATALRQHTGIGALAKCGRQGPVDVTQQLPQGAAGFDGNARTRHRHRQTRQWRESDGMHGVHNTSWCGSRSLHKTANDPCLPLR
jgi:hypothetical protein